MGDRGGESLTLGDLGWGVGRVQPLLCLRSWERERERKWEHSDQCEKLLSMSLSVCEGPNMARI